MINTK